MTLRFRARHFTFLTAVCVVLFFQNCSSTSNSSLDSTQSYQSMLPFAYNATIDTIAYMSCSNIQDSSYLPRAYFTFRAGAYNAATGGLSLTTGFYNATQYYTPTARGQALAQSDYNSNIILSLSIRNESNYQNLWASTTPTAGMDLDSFLPEIDSDAEIAGPLASLPLGVNMNYFPGTDSQRLMEASLRFFSSETDAQNTRNTIGADSSILVAGYPATADTQDTSLRSPLDIPGYNNGATLPTTTVISPYTNANTIYGVGYKMNFALPVGYSAGDRRVLSYTAGITEKDMNSGLARSATWDCGAGGNYQFEIVRPEDQQAGYVICDATVDTTANATQVAALTAIRRVLRVEDWYVDLNHHCVMPKNTGDYCYGAGIDQATTSATTTIPYVEYGVSACADTATTLCPHFVSVCIRQ